MPQIPLSPIQKVLAESSAPSRGIFKPEATTGDARTAPAPVKSAQVPAEYLPAFKASAEKYGVPANVLIGMADKESTFDSRAVGQQTQWGTAKGLMGYLDATAKNLGFNAYDAPASIDAAARQIRERLDKGYSLDDAVREHFAGPNKAGWGKKTAAYSDDVFARSANYENVFGEPAKVGATDAQNAPELAPEGGYTAEQAQAALEEMNAAEPGRFQIATPEEVAADMAKNGGAMIPEQEAGASTEEPGLKGGRQSKNMGGEGTDDFAAATSKSLRNIPGNFKEAAGGLIRNISEGVDDQTLVSNASDLGVVDAMRENGIITMKPSKSGFRTKDVPTLPNGKLATVAEMAKYIRENVGGLLTGEQQEDIEGLKQSAMTQFGAKLGKEARADRLKINPKGPLAKYGSMIIGSTAEMLPALLAGAVTRSPALTLSMIGGQVKGASYETGREAGLNPDEAGAYATAHAMAEAIPSALPVHAILKAPAGKFFKGLLMAGAAETVQEGITGAIQAGIDKGTIRPDMTWKEARQQIVDSMIVGFGSGVALRAGFDGAGRAKEALKSPERKLADAMEDEVNNAGFADSAEDVARRQFDPGREAAQDGELGDVVDLEARRAAEAEAQAAAESQAAADEVFPNAAPPAGPLARAAAAAPPPPQEAPPAPTDAAPDSALRPDAGADAFIGEPGSTINVNLDGAEPFRARLEGYVDGDAMLIDEAGDRYQMTREELANSENVGSPTIQAGKEEKNPVADAIADVEQAIAEAEPAPAPKKEAKANSAEDLGELKNMASGIGESLRDHLWSRFEDGQVTEQDGSPKSPILQAAQMLRDAGSLETKADFIDMAERVTKAMDGKTGAPRNEAIRGVLREIHNEKAATRPAVPASEVVKGGSKPAVPASEAVKTETKPAVPASKAAEPASKPAAPAPGAARSFKFKGIADGYLSGKGQMDTHESFQQEDGTWSVRPIEGVVEKKAATKPTDKWFGTAEKANAYLAKAGLTETHVAVVDGGRHVIREKAPDVKETAPDVKETAVDVKPKKDGEWQSFGAETGTLGIPRADMPQVKAEDRGAMVNFLKARGIESKAEAVKASTIKPTQAEFSTAKVQAAKDREGGNRSILISADGHVVDGHHQWLAALDGDQYVGVIRLDAPIRDLLPVIHEFPSSTVSPESAKKTPGQVEKADKSASEPLQLRRVSRKDFDWSRQKPQGTYASIVDGRADFKSPFGGEDGGFAHDLNYTPKNPLVTPETIVAHARFGRRGSGQSSAGVAALKSMIPAAEFTDALKMSKDAVLAEIESRFPGTDTSRVHDAYEALEIWGAQEARKAGHDVIVHRDESMPDFSEAVLLGDPTADAPAKTSTPAPSKNTIFTESAADKARAILKSKLGQLNTGIDPEIMQAGITLAGYHIEKGARSFASYAKEMTKDLGDIVRPYLKSWYMGVKYDPRAAGFDGMSTPVDVDAFDLSKPINIEDSTDDASTGERVERDSKQPEAAKPVDEAVNVDEPAADDGSTGKPGKRADESGRNTERDKRVPEDGATTGGKRSDNGVHKPDGEFKPSQPAARSVERDGSRSDSKQGHAVSEKRAKQVTENAAADGTSDLAKRINAQRAAVGTPTKWGDKASIDKALPLLLPPQREDVLKAEIRFANHNGMLYTNGTGTGKTATGVGIALRHYNDGKTNILVIVPTDKIANDWTKFALMAGLPLAQLDGLADNGGKGPVVTTYANFGNNKSLAARDWDLFIPDESHYLSSNADGDSTAALDQLRALTGHHAGFYAWAKSKYAKAYERTNDTYQELIRSETNESYTPADQARAKRNHEAAAADWAKIVNENRPKWEARWANQENIPKVSFLSATPFAYAKSVDYAEGFLFHYKDPASMKGDSADGLTYNSGDAQQKFMIENFGYRMRYNKLTQPEAGVDSQVMEQQFNSKLKREGALSGRRLDVPFDYDRKFVMAEDAIGKKIDDALEYLREGDGGKWRKVFDLVNSSFDHQSRMYMLEALKARSVVDMIKADIAAGRKVVVFHDYNKGGAVNPFWNALRNARDPEARSLAREVLADPRFQLDLSNLQSPIDTLTSAFPDILLFNGTVPKGKRRKNADAFNDDEGTARILLAQSDAAREGVSLHDTSGKFPRVMYNLGMPTKPVAATQIEGRTYRTGQASDAMFRYLTIGTGWESAAFASKIAERASTAENLALGEEARNLKSAFINAYNEAEAFAITPNDGKGGKSLDTGATSKLSDFDRAKSFYWAQQRNTKRRDQREGADYFATAEPVGLKKVQWADIRQGDRVLEPSAGHGAIARFFPERTDVTMIEPSYALSQRAGLANGDAKVINDTFESHHVTNKYDSIVMNPPFGVGGKTAVEHLTKAARHLSEGGRIVATIPRGPLADRRLDAFFADPAHANLHTVADIEMPGVAFERAGTGVATRVLVLERNSSEDPGINPMKISLDDVKSTKELFDRIENLDLPPRKAERSNSLLDGSGRDGNRYDVTNLEAELREGPLGEIMGPLIDNGTVVLHDTAPTGVHQLAQAWTDPDGTIHLVANQLTSENYQPVVLHEAFHSGAKSLLESAQWTNLMARLNTFYKAAESGQMKGEWADAFRRVDGAMKAGDEMSRLRAIEELGAYAIENYDRAPPGIKKWVDGVLGAIKDWAFRKFGLQLGEVTPAQLRSLAVAILKNGAPAPKSTSEGPKFSISDTPPSKKETDNWFSNKLTDAMSGPKSSGQYSVLALAPMDRMIEELSGNNVHAREYLKLKRDMDAYRAKKHVEYDKTAQKWLSINVRHREAAQDMGRLMHDATIEQLDPAEPFVPKATPRDLEIIEQQPNTPEGARAMDKVKEDEARKEAHDELSARFNALPAELQDHYRTVRDTYKAMTEELDAILMQNLADAIDMAARKAERVYESEMQDIVDEGLTGKEKAEAEALALKKYNTATTKQRMNKKARLTLLRQQFESNRLEGPYFPLARFGDYFVTVRDRETGKVLSFSRYESKGEQAKAAKAEQRGDVVVQTGLMSSKGATKGSVDASFIASIEEILGGAEVADSVKDQVWQRYLETMPEMSMRKGFIHRKNREGYTQNATRAFANRMFHGSHQLGRLKYGAKMQETMDLAGDFARKTDTPERDTAVVNEIVRRHDYVMNPKGSVGAQMLTSAAFVYQLSMSPAAALVNMTQTVMIGVPVIGAEFGMANTLAEITKASAAFATGLGKSEKSKLLNADEKKAMQAAYDAGLIESTQSHNLAGVGDGVGVSYSAIRTKVMGIVAWMFHQTERANREVTFLTAYRLAKKSGMSSEAAVTEGIRLTYKTHFDYANTNRPRAMHGDTAKVALVFRNYQVNMLWRLFRDTHQVVHANGPARTEAIKQLGGISAMMALHAGVRGVWMYGIAMMIASMIFGDDAEEKFKKATVEAIGPTAAGMLLNGVPGHLAGIDITGRVGMADLWFRSPDRQLEGKDEFTYWQSQFLGFIPSMAQNVFVGVNQAVDGKVSRGIETAAPKAVKDLMRAYRFGKEGATTLKGETLVEHIAPAQILAQAMGFTPAIVSERYSRNSALMNAQSRIKDKRRMLMDKFAVATKLKDTELRAETLEEIKKFNSENKTVAIRPANLMQSLQGRAKRSKETDSGVRLDPRLNRTLRDNLGPAIYQ